MARVLIRPGGRSERIQLAVHRAVHQLTAERSGSELTIALIAERAEVPPSTIYRRWNTLAQLLADVANERFLPDSTPSDTGSLQGDLAIWLEQLVDDMNSGPGRALFKERIANVQIAQRAAGYAYTNLVSICDRCGARGETVPSPDRLMDMIVAPIHYRAFFLGQDISKAYQEELIENAIKSYTLTSALEGQTSIGEYVLYEGEI